MLRRVRLHGSCGRPQGQGDKEGHAQRGCGLHHRRQRRPHGGRVPGDHSDGQFRK